MDNTKKTLKSYEETRAEYISLLPSHLQEIVTQQKNHVFTATIETMIHVTHTHYLMLENKLKEFYEKHGFEVDK